MNSTKPLLGINALTVTVDCKPIIHDVTLSLAAGEIHALMGPNGSGKSTLAHALMGHPKYTITSGTITLNGKDITTLPPHERARSGLFLSMQHPREIDGVSVMNFLRTALNSTREKKLSILEANRLIETTADHLGIPKEFLSRSLNKGFSGGEKKRMEALQLLLLNPSVAILDETDSGLDVDALKAVANAIKSFHTPHNALLVITHYRRILDYLKPHRVSIMRDGHLIKTGSTELITEVETHGFTHLH